MERVRSGRSSLLEDAEIAEALGLSTRTVRRDRDKARLLPAHALRD